jgi:threonylcarbamoyladenosine tRNA methylthiotransferase MtaB
MPHQVPMHVRRERNEMLRILSTKKMRAFSEKFMGSSRPVLFEQHHPETGLTGYTDNYIKVNTEGDSWQVNFIHDVTLEEIDDYRQCVVGKF